MNLLHIENELIRLNHERHEAIRAHELFKNNNTKELQELIRQKEMGMNGIDVEKIKCAEFILDVRLNGEYNDRCVSEAIKDIASGVNKMQKEYFGVKNYSGWTHQECDCKYGMGPTHGYIVFLVGYHRGFRSVELTDDEKESCLYYLNLLRNEDTREAIKTKKVG